jgi:hypothetical protein
MRPDPRPSSRYVATSSEWEDIVRFKSGPCRGCGGASLLPVTYHHLVPKSLGGDDVPGNVLPLCGHGTTGCHGAIENHTRGWEAIASAVRDSLTPLELQYSLAKKGKHWLERYLPHDPVLCAKCAKPVRADAASSSDDVRERLPARRKKEWTMEVPDDTEQGWDVLQTLSDGLAVDLGFNDERSRLRRYHAVVAALTFAMLNKQQFLAEVKGEK